MSTNRILCNTCESSHIVLFILLSLSASCFVYDIMHYSETIKINALFMLIDFQKASDSFSWPFLFKVIDYFGFDDTPINWIKTFNNSITAHVIQCGILSESTTIELGCRQGDLISPYLLILGAKMLRSCK